MKNRKILVIDDECDFLDSIRRGLVITGYRDVTVLSMPAQVKELLAENCYEIALIDVSMPVMNGMEVLKYIKANCPDTVCFMVSAHSDACIAKKCIELGARDYLLKPISRETLLQTLESI